MNIKKIKREHIIINVLICMLVFMAFWVYDVSHWLETEKAKVNKIVFESIDAGLSREGVSEVLRERYLSPTTQK